LFLISKK